MEGSHTADNASPNTGVERRDRLVQAKRQDPKWNELQFVSWSEFKQMVPTILQLEVTRIGQLIELSRGNVDFHNALVGSRYALRQFIASVPDACQETIAETCAPHLRAAILNFPPPPDNLDARAKETCRYVLDRLKYVNNRIDLIY